MATFSRYPTVSGSFNPNNTINFTTNQIVEGTTTAALLRITQLGTGNALLVEDSTNPDSTPVVIDGSGYVGIGTATPFQPAGYGALTVDGSSGSIYSGRVASTETFRIQSTAASTTINGIANLPILFNTNNTERMRIDSAGRVGIGISPISGRSLTVAAPLVTSSPIGIFSAGEIQSDATGSSSYYKTFASTATASFTSGFLYHYLADQGTFGVGSTVTNQYGFAAGASMVNATNNYGFWGNIAAGTNRWNLYMVGTAANYMAGRLGIGTPLTAGAMAQVTNTTLGDDVLILKGATGQTGDFLDIQNSAGTSVFTVDNTGTTKTVYGVLELGFARAADGYAYIDLIGDSTYSDYGLRLLRGNTGANTISQLIHRGAGSLSITTQDAAPLLFSTTSLERMRISSTGTVGIGATTFAGVTLRLGRAITGAAFSQAMLVDGTIQPEVTSRSDTVWSNPSVADAVTLPSINHFYASSPAIGVGSTVTSVAGFTAESNLGSNYSGTVTNAYGFVGNLASGTSRWNLFMGNNAANYLAGRLGVGAASSTTGPMMQVVNTNAADKVLVVKGHATQTGDFLDIQNSAGTSQLRVDSAGQVGIASPPTVNVRLTVTGGSTNSANPIILLNGVTGSGALYLHNDMGAGSYNSIVSAGSKGIIATGANSTTTRASFVIAPWSDVPYGVRFEGGATTNILQHGTSILSPSAAANKALIVKGLASQTANLQEWQDSASAVKAFISPTGAAQFVSIDGGTP